MKAGLDLDPPALFDETLSRWARDGPVAETLNLRRAPEFADEELHESLRNGKEGKKGGRGDHPLEATLE
jgi:hypothetical protein